MMIRLAIIDDFESHSPTIQQAIPVKFHPQEATGNRCMSKAAIRFRSVPKPHGSMLHRRATPVNVIAGDEKLRIAHRIAMQFIAVRWKNLQAYRPIRTFHQTLFKVLP
jgi:hypothetical protein